MEEPFFSKGPADTEAYGAALADTLRPGSILALYGDLGAGKTSLVRGLCSALGILAEEVSSPSFAIVNEYTGGRIPVYHFDAYRIRHQAEFFELGYEDYFFGEGITVVEWPERVEELLPEGAIRLKLDHTGPETRTIRRI